MDTKLEIIYKLFKAIYKYRPQRKHRKEMNKKKKKKKKELNMKQNTSYKLS